MSFYLSNYDTHPTGDEPLEFIDDPTWIAAELAERAHPPAAATPVTSQGDPAGWRARPARLWPFGQRPWFTVDRRRRPR